MKTQFRKRFFFAIFCSLFLAACTNNGEQITVPKDGTNFTAVAGIEEVVLSWSKSADSDTKEYWLTISPLVIDAFSVNKDLETITVKNLKGGIQYTFTLLVKNVSGGVSKGVSITGTPSAVDRISPSEVTNLVAVSDDAKITLNWTKPTETDLSSYELNYEPGGVSVALAREVESYVIEGLTNGTEYTIVLTAKDEIGNISLGSSVKATPSVGDTTPPTEASDFVFSGDYSATQFTMSWANPSDADFQELELTYFYDPVNSTTVTIQGEDNSFTIDGSYEQNYTLILKSKDASGNFSAGITKKIRFGNFSPSSQAEMDAFDNDNVAVLAGKIKINGTDITDLSHFSNLEIVEGKFDITANSGLTNLDVFSNLKLIVSRVYVANNVNLSNFCGLKNLINSGGFPDSYTVSGNAANPTKQEISDNCL